MSSKGGEVDKLARANEHAPGRRSFLLRSSALGDACLIEAPRTVMAEAPLEISSIRFVHGPWLCYAPQYLAEDLLRMEGFTDIDYRKIEINIPATLVKAADFGIVGAPGLVPVIDSGMPVKTLQKIRSPKARAANP